MKGQAAAVICAAGSSRRMGGLKKEYLLLEPGLTVLGAAVKAFAARTRIRLLVIVIPPGDEDERLVRECLPPELLSAAAEKPLFFVPGGPTRRVSVHNALSFLSTYNPSCVLIHDGARPWVDADLIERTIDAALRFGAVTPVLPLVETPKELDEKGFVRRHLKRAQVGTAQTPQGFAFPAILRAHEMAAEREINDSIDYTDDTEVWGEFMGPVAVIPGSQANRKITFPGDIS
ncbi:2-C-methyl-D-erythritol 4-phosphate cytidylyltransferase [Spirochaetia bacterium]|nr:2-C-methyl-D-erythritol 4-phosphate cytidylyltransferase [Spirochaetia bacterium]